MDATTKLQCENCVVFNYSKQGHPALYFIVNTKYGNAIKRNLFKRRVRGLFKTFFDNSDIGLIVKPLKSNIQYSDLLISFKKLKQKYQTILN